MVEHNGKFLMIRIAYGHKHWTFPGGGVDRGELPEMAVKREIREEVGIEVEKPLPIGEYFNTRHYSKDTVYCFYGKVASDYFNILITMRSQRRNGFLHQKYQPCNRLR